MATRVPLVTYAEYLALEEKSDEKHTWFDGQIFSMAGGTPEHTRLGSRVQQVARLALERAKKPCEVFGSDLRVRAGRVTSYPDGTIACGKLEMHPEDGHAVTNPSAIFEVLSPSTEAFDRGQKFHALRTLPSLVDYVLLSQETPLVEVFTRAGGGWSYRAFGPGERAVLGMGIELDVDTIYANPMTS